MYIHKWQTVDSYSYERENPLVMKSLPLAAPSFEPSFLEYRLLMVELWVIIFRRFFFSFSSARTRAVSEEVAAFFIPLTGALLRTGVEVWLRSLGSVDVLDASAPVASLVLAAVASACFLRFFEPGAFLRECVRPCSASL